MTRSVWANEHPDSYDSRLETVFLRLGLGDTSWHNDVSASFETSFTFEGRDGCQLRVWVSPLDPTDREDPLMGRFQVDVYDAEDMGNSIAPSWETETVESVLAKVCDLLNKSDRVKAERAEKLASMARMKAEEEARLQPLIDEYEVFSASIMTAYNIKLSSADEHLFDPALPDYARAYLREFVRRWEVAQQGDA